MNFKLYGLIPFFALTLLVSGCGTFEKRTPVADIPLKTIQVELKENTALAPGESDHLIVRFTDSSGNIWSTDGPRKSSIAWKDLALATTIVEANNSGKIKLPSDPRLSNGATGKVVVTVPAHPELHAEISIPTEYNRPYRALFSGSSGSNGLDGSNGSSGSDGTPGSIDPLHPSAGGNGTNGGNGGDGDNGHDGSNGPDLIVKATVMPDSRKLIQVSVAIGRELHYYLIDPDGGSIEIASRGGSGGRGGRGGSGGRGGHGGSGSPSGTDGISGSNGSDGRAGFDGRDGKISIFYDPSVAPYLSIFKVPKNGPSVPKFIEQPVSPLW